MLEVLLRFCYTDSYFFQLPYFSCSLSDVNLGRLVRGDAADCLVPPTACAVMELLEDLGETFCHNYYINFSLIFSSLVLTERQI